MNYMQTSPHLLKFSFALLMPVCFLITPGFTTAQELRDSTRVSNRTPPLREGEIPALQNEQPVPAPGIWSPAWQPIVPERSLAEKMFTPRMLRDATLGDPNRSVRLYRADPNYYRMKSFALFGPSGTSPGPTSSSTLNDVISALYVRLREEIASQNLSAYSYMMLPRNTGMIMSFDDCKETALMRGEEQTADIFSRLQVGVWPYRTSLYPLPPQMPRKINGRP